MAITLSTALNSSNPGDTNHFPALITATGNDTTGTILGPVIDNSDGRVEGINLMLAVSASSGTSPTANIRLMGSNDGVNFYQIQSGQATPAAVQSGAVSTTAPATIGLDVASLARNGNFPRKLRADIVQGGTTPGLTGVLSGFIRRTHVFK